ncbi:polyketide synthase [Dichotomopilus funicola]|uniref:Polyketide synthase n=1 Tax=Dichotomopilus funicola TaxID=1934379 RepID=A0AAN6ZMV6_9PEZI|nr:polyketide synthase [Dichotomopilus funicola]
MEPHFNDDLTGRPAFLLFGDQSLDSHGFLAHFFRQPHMGELARVFLRQVERALTNVIEKLPVVERAALPRFLSLQQLNERYHHAELKHAGVDAALLTISQISHYLNHTEKHCSDITHPKHTHLIGLCTGLWAAAAVSLAPSLPDLVHIGVQAVLLAFRTGSYVHSIAQRLSPTSDHSASWTYIFPDVDHKEAAMELTTFHEATGIPPASRAYISATSRTRVAISGPPRTLDSLVSNRVLQATPIAVPVHGPYHAPHLHSAANVERILGLDTSEVNNAFHRTQPRSPVMSCATGTWLPAGNTNTLLTSIASTILNEALSFDQVLGGCIDKALEFQGKKCFILPLGPTQNATTLERLLHEKGLEVTLRTPPPITEESIGSSVGNHGRNGKCKLAIVGMSGRFPDAADIEEFWKLLEAGLDVHREVPPDRFDVKTHFDPTGKKDNTSHTPYGCWIKEPGLFDPRFFQMSPREARQTDPMQRMALTTAYEALEMSGYMPNRTPSTRLDRIGTFYGQTSDDWREINAAQKVDTYFITGGVRAFGPGRINYHFGFSGPSLNIDTACSSSAAAMQVACTALWARDCDTAVVGGLSCMTNPDIFAGLSAGQFLSKKGPCSTFDNGADGYCRGDGCASVIVKRLDDAIADKDRVLAVILGTATNHSADAISITHPHGPTQSALSTAILDEAGVDPHDVDYVEMHGTGTQAGDGTEMVSVTNVFAPADRPRPPGRPLFLGAVKANVGHGEAASGVTALIKVLLMLEKSLIPRHVGIKPDSRINETFPDDLLKRGVNIAYSTTPFRRNDDHPRRVFINNFSAAGGNTGLLLEDAPAQPPAKSDARSHHVVTLTARAKSSLIKNAERLVQWLRDHSETPLSHVAYSTTARKLQHHWRISVAGASTSDIIKAIERRLEESSEPLTALKPLKPGNRKIALAFTGQGSQHVGMGKELYEHYSVFRNSIDGFVDLAVLQGFPSFLPFIDGSMKDSASPTVTQLALTCFEMALARLWASWGIKPTAVVGHSLGEYAALEVAGVLSASDVIYLVGSRAEMLTKRCSPGSHGMLAIQGGIDAVYGVLKVSPEPVHVACVNGPTEMVLSGERRPLENIAAALLQRGLKSTHLKVPFAFHSQQVDVILDDFEKLAEGVTFNTPNIPVISTVTGHVIDSESIDASYLRRHAREPVNLHSGIINAKQSGLVDKDTIWIEIGPHQILANLITSNISRETVAVPTLRRQEQCYKTLANSLARLHGAGVNLDFNEYHREFADSVRLLNLPRYAFDENNYWIQYEGDWCLTKNRIPAAVEEVPKVIKPTFSTTTVQRIVKETIEGDKAIIETESDLFQEQLRNAVSGHMVNGTPLCPSSLYGDMAMTICDYAYKLLRPEANKIGCNVANMEVPKTLILDETAETQILRLNVIADAQLGSASLVFSTGEGKKRTEHAHCTVYYGNLDEWQKEFARANYLIKSRIEFLEDAEKRGKASKIGRGLAYKLFSALVDYHPRYRGMEEVILDSNTCEATAKISFQTTEQDGTFHFSPYHIDSVCHISGFIINGTDAIDSRQQVYISHGWGSMRFTEIPDAKKTYRSYIRMQPIDGTQMMAGDAYVFDNGKIIGMAGDIKFQCIPRRILDTVLPPRAPKSTAKTALKEAPKVVPSKKKTKEMVTPSNIGEVNQRLKSVVSSVMDLIARELNCSLDELADTIAFAEVGVDSLMALTVAGKALEELDLKIDSNAFLDYPHVGPFKKYLTQFEKPDRRSTVRSPISGASSDNEENAGGVDDETPASPGVEPDSNVTTPLDDDETERETYPGISNQHLRSVVHEIIAAEVGVKPHEISDAPDLPSLGVDSIMGLNIVGKVLERTGVKFPGNPFLEYSTIQEAEQALGIQEIRKKVKVKAKAQKADDKPVPAAPSETKHPKIGLEEPCPPKPPRPTEFVDEYPHRRATSVLLSGKVHKTANPNQLFMIPDGSGSATSYTQISDLGEEWSVWGLFSPFMKTPEEYTCGVYGMAAKFILEMKTRQPEGPYSVAGWSAGGVIAYEIIYQLVKAGDTVANLIIIDAPCPVTIEPLPQGLHKWFASIGLLGDGKQKIPEWLLPHFSASITALSNYDAAPIPKDKCPKVMSIWCEDGVCHLPDDPRPEPYPKGHALFLLDNRSDFGPNRWDEYLDIDKMQFRHMPGNHFSMMNGSLAKQLQGFLREAVSG